MNYIWQRGVIYRPAKSNKNLSLTPGHHYVVSSRWCAYFRPRVLLLLDLGPCISFESVRQPGFVTVTNPKFSWNWLQLSGEKIFLPSTHFSTISRQFEWSVTWKINSTNWPLSRDTNSVRAGPWRMTDELIQMVQYCSSMLPPRLVTISLPRLLERTVTSLVTSIIITFHWKYWFQCTTNKFKYLLTTGIGCELSKHPVVNDSMVRLWISNDNKIYAL